MTMLAGHKGLAYNLLYGQPRIAAGNRQQEGSNEHMDGGDGFNGAVPL